MLLENHAWLLKCLGYCQNLIPLKVFERWNPDGDIDVAFEERQNSKTRRRHENFGNFYEDPQEIIQMRDYFGRRNRPREQLPTPAPPHDNRIGGDQDPVQPILEVNPNPMLILKNLQCLKLF